MGGDGARRGRWGGGVSRGWVGAGPAGFCVGLGGFGEGLGLVKNPTPPPTALKPESVPVVPQTPKQPHPPQLKRPSHPQPHPPPAPPCHRKVANGVSEEVQLEMARGDVPDDVTTGGEAMSQRIGMARTTLGDRLWGGCGRARGGRGPTPLISTPNQRSVPHSNTATHTPPGVNPPPPHLHSTPHSVHTATTAATPHPNRPPTPKRLLPGVCLEVDHV